MKYIPIQEDYQILKQTHRKIFIKLNLADMYTKDENGNLVFSSNYKPIAAIEGEAISGSCSVSSDSVIRRTLDLTMFVKDDSYHISADSKIWLNKYILPYYGLEGNTDGKIHWYPMGVFIIKTGGYFFDAQNQKLTLSCLDRMSLLNGDIAGQIGGMQTLKIAPGISLVDKAPTLNFADNQTAIGLSLDNSIQSYGSFTFGFSMGNIPFSTRKTYENSPIQLSINGLPYYPLKSNDRPVILADLENDTEYLAMYSSADTAFLFMGKQNTIKNAMISAITQFSDFADYYVADIGADQPVSDANQNPTHVPYTMEFSSEDTAYTIIEKLLACYSGYEAFIDVYGNFICDKYPTCKEDLCILDETLFNSMIISEDTSYDFSAVKNITEVFGKCIETSRYDDVPDYRNNVLTLTLEHYCEDINGITEGTYPEGDILGITFPDGFVQKKNPSMRVYVPTSKASDEADNSGIYLPEYPIIMDFSHPTAEFPANTMKGGMGYCFYVKGGYFVYMGEFQVHAVAMLVDRIPDEKLQAQHRLAFGCNTISYICVNDDENRSPFTIEKCGERHSKLSGGDYEQIYTSDLARQRAEYENWKTTRFNDTITLECMAIPWLDVNEKVKYTSLQTGKTSEYIINSINLSFDSPTMTIEMRKFYPMYAFVTEV